VTSTGTGRIVGGILLFLLLGLFSTRVRAFGVVTLLRGLLDRWIHRTRSTVDVTQPG
jgi:hypothetical protein